LEVRAADNVSGKQKTEKINEVRAMYLRNEMRADDLTLLLMGLKVPSGPKKGE
jgi:hypothetical protein